MSTMRYREALNAALREEMRRDERVLLMGEDIGVFGGAFKVTEGLLEEFGEKRVRDTPISENTIVGMGVGAAMTGLRPVVELMTINFSLLALDQIVNHAAHIHYMFGGQARVPLVVRMPQGAGHQLGPTHSHCFEAMFLQVPGLLVAVPATAADAKGLLKTAIRDENPVVFIEHESLYGVRGEVPEEEENLVQFGVARIALWQTTGIFDYGAHWGLIALTVGIGLIGIVTFGSLAGSMLPFILKRLGFDPASASAPFVATLVDVTGLVIYFSVALIVLHGTLL